MCFILSCCHPFAPCSAWLLQPYVTCCHVFVFRWHACLCDIPNTSLHILVMLRVSDRCKLHLLSVVFAAPTFKAKHSRSPSCLLTTCILVGVGTVSLLECLTLWGSPCMDLKIHRVCARACFSKLHFVLPSITMPVAWVSLGSTSRVLYLYLMEMQNMLMFLFLFMMLISFLAHALKHKAYFLFFHL